MKIQVAMVVFVVRFDRLVRATALLAGICGGGRPAGGSIHLTISIAEESCLSLYDVGCFPCVISDDHRKDGRYLHVATVTADTDVHNAQIPPHDRSAACTVMPMINKKW